MMPNEKEALARRRYFAIAMLRLGGAAMAVFGLVVIAGRIESMPRMAGYALLLFGLFELAVMPRLLARAWRTPPGA